MHEPASITRKAGQAALSFGDFPRTLTVRIQPAEVRVRGCRGWNRVPQKDRLIVLSPVPMNVTLFGNRVSVDVMKKEVKMSSYQSKAR